MRKINFLPFLVFLCFASCEKDSVIAESTPDLAVTKKNMSYAKVTPASYLALEVPANMSLATYTVTNNVATFTKSGLIGTITGTGADRKWNPTLVVDSSKSWTEIKINDNVTLTGNLQIKKTDFKVTGVNRDRSVIDGSKTPYNKGGSYRFLCAIRHEGLGTITIKNVKSLNPANFHFHGWGKGIIDNVKIIENGGTHSTDAFHYELGATVDNSYVDTYDDVLYIGEVTKISNSTIYHNKNGAIFMASWGEKVSEIGTGITVAENCTFIDNFKSSGSTDNYAHGIVGWSQKEDNASIQIAKVKFVNCSFIANPSKSVTRSSFVSFGRLSGATDVSKIENGTIELIDAKCDWNSISWGIGVDKTKTKLKMTTCKN